MPAQVVERVGPDELLADEAVLGEGDQQVGRLARHLADLGSVAARLAHLGDPVEQQARGARRPFPLPARVRRGLQGVAYGLFDAGRGRERAVYGAPVVRGRVRFPA